MEWTVTLSFAKLKVQVNRLGQDYNIVLQGGDKPHIGCTVLSVPRPSLTGDGSISATSSTLNVTGHKDDILCRYLAEEVCRIKNSYGRDHRKTDKGSTAGCEKNRRRPD